MAAVTERAIQEDAAAFRGQQTDHLLRHDRFVGSVVARHLIWPASSLPPRRTSV